MMQIIFWIALIVCGVGVYVAYNMLRKYETMERKYVNIKDQITNTLIMMRALDDKHMFESDDEIGIIFDQLVHIIEETSEHIEEQE